MSLLSGAPLSGSVETQHSIKSCVSFIGGSASRPPPMFSPPWAGAVVALLILFETSWFLALGAAHSGTPIFQKNRATPKRAVHSRLCGVLQAELVQSPPSSGGGVAHPGAAKMAHCPSAINT